MTDAHRSWHPCTQALKADWQEFAYERVEGVGGVNQWHAMTCPVAPPHRPERVQSPFFTPDGYRDGDISVIVHQR